MMLRQLPTVRVYGRQLDLRDESVEVAVDREVENDTYRRRVIDQCEMLLLLLPPIFLFLHPPL